MNLPKILLVTFNIYIFCRLKSSFLTTNDSLRKHTYLQIGLAAYSILHVFSFNRIGRFTMLCPTIIMETYALWLYMFIKLPVTFLLKTIVYVLHCHSEIKKNPL